MNTKNLILIATVGLGSNLSADVLRLAGGPALQGTLISANSREISFLGVDGAAKTYPINAVKGVDFAPLPPPPAPPPAPEKQPAADSAAVVTVPAGTQIVVRTIDPIDGNTSRNGARYRASIDDPVMLGSNAVIPRGATCTVEVVSLSQGEGVALRLRDINIGGKAYGTSTEYAEIEATGTSKKKKAVRRGVGLGALGAGIGAAAGGGQGAAIGAAVGGGVGAMSAAAAKGKQISVPTETRLLFALKAPLPIN
jgi:hypothetical protein